MKSISATAVSALMLFIPFLSYASNYCVKAVVVNSQGEPEEFATWRIFPADTTATTPLTGNITDASGMIDTPLDIPGQFRLSLVGIDGSTLEQPFSVTDEQPVADLGRLAFSDARTRRLEEITVTAQKPIVVKEIDRIGYDVQADPEVATAPLIDILRKVPMVAVDAEGNITVNGSSDFKI